MILLIKIIWFVSIAYLITYVVLSYLLVITSSLGRSSDIHRKENISNVTRLINIVIFAKNNLEDVIKLINSLKSQNYPPDKYSINIVIDNKHSKLDSVLEHIDSIKIWKLNNEDGYTSIYSSISKYLEKNLASEYANGYVFLNSSNVVKENFLERVNIALDKNEISQACIGTKAPYASTISAITYIYNRTFNRTLNAGIFHLTKGSLLFDHGLIISQPTLEKCPFNLSENCSEIDYFYYLLKNKIYINWAPEVIIYDKIAEDIHDFSQWKINKLFNVISGIKRNLKTALLNPSGILYSLTLLKPGILVYFCIAVIALLSGYLITYNPFNIDLWFYIPSFCFIIYFFSELAGILTARCVPKDLHIWMNSFTYFFPEAYLTVIYILKRAFKGKPEIKKETIIEQEPVIEPEKTFKQEKSEVVITDGKRPFNCTLTTQISPNENNLTLTFKSKKFTTKNYTNIEDAFEEINNKLESKGFKLIICNNCGYFAYSKRSHRETSGASGHCFLNKEGTRIQFDELTNIWNSCPHYTPKENKEQILENWRNSLTAEQEAELNEEGNI